MFKNLSSISIIYIILLEIPKTSFNKAFAQTTVSSTVSNSSSNNLLCMMQLETGKVVDLSSLCLKTNKPENLNLSPAPREKLNLSPEQIEMNPEEAKFRNQISQEMKAEEAEFKNRMYQECKRINRPDSFVVYPGFKQACERAFQQNF